MIERMSLLATLKIIHENSIIYVQDAKFHNCELH
jgi:hypothetical protein